MDYVEIYKDTIALNCDVQDWKDAIRQAGKLLLNEEYISQEYIEECINNVIEHGPYIVIDPQIAIAHSSPGPSVHTTSISLITTKDDVEFGHEENDPVRIVIMFATTNSKNHLEILQKVVDVFSCPINKKRIIEAIDFEEVLDIFKGANYEKIF